MPGRSAGLRGVGIRGAEGEKASLANEEAVGRQAQGDVVVQAAPGASLEVAEPDLLLELAVIPLDPPATLGMAYQIGQRRLGRQRDQPVAPVTGRVGVLDEQPLLRAEPAGRGARRGAHAANRPLSGLAPPSRHSTACQSPRSRARTSTRAAPARASPPRPRRSAAGIPEPTGAVSRSPGTAAA